MKKAALFFILVAQVLAITGFWAWNHMHHAMGNQLTGDLMGRLLAWGRLAGLLAAFGILFELILIGRIRWVEQVFGLDRLTRLHHVVGFSLVVFLISHSILLTIGHSMQAGVELHAQFIDFCKTWEDLLAAIIGQDLMIVAILISIFTLLSP
jgi:predicted ferric reductase